MPIADAQFDVRKAEDTDEAFVSHDMISDPSELTLIDADDFLAQVNKAARARFKEIT